MARSWLRSLMLLLWAVFAFPGIAGAAPHGMSGVAAAGPVSSVQDTHGGDTPPSSSLQLPDPPQEFSTYDGGWLKMAYHPSLAAKVRVLQDEADTVRTELEKMMGRPVLGRVHVQVGRTAGEMETLAPKGTSFPRYASGVAYSELGLILLTATPRFPGERHDLAEVFRHELAHIALHDAVSRDRVPRWFNEGFAVHASREAATARMQTLWTATLSRNLIPFEKITRSFPADSNSASIAYAQAADMVRFLLRGGEEHRFQALIRRVAGGQTFDEALLDAYATDMYTLEKGWREDVARRYTFWPVLFGGSLIWVVGFGLLIWGYARRKKRAEAKLARWAREEALEDAQRKWAEAVLGQGGRIRVVVAEASTTTRPDPELQRPVVVPLSQPLPSIEHDGQKHTLH